jgi:KDO2-lipid IV(A) lauroyltransferase
MVSVDTRAFDDLLAAGRGAVVAAAHTGNWDLVLCAAGSKTALTVVTKRQSVRWINWLWQKLRACHGVRLVEKGRAAREALRALGRGEAVAMMIDQAPDRRRGAIQVPFLGQLAWVDLSPALIALRARAPLIAAFPHRCADDIHRVEIGAVLWPSRFPSREWAEQAMRRLTADLEAFVVAHPEQWLWMHRRWKDPPEAGRAQRVSRPK